MRVNECLLRMRLLSGTNQKYLLWVHFWWCRLSGSHNDISTKGCLFYLYYCVFFFYISLAEWFYSAWWKVSASPRVMVAILLANTNNAPIYFSMMTLRRSMGMFVGLFITLSLYYLRKWKAIVSIIYSGSELGIESITSDLAGCQRHHQLSYKSDLQATNMFV